MARTWLSIRVELIEGGGQVCWPRPGRVFAAARSHTFTTFARAIDDAFARWDRAHLREFELAGGVRIGPGDDEDSELLDADTTTLSRLQLGDQFVYVFDLGDQWVIPDPGSARWPVPASAHQHVHRHPLQKRRLRGCPSR